MRSSQARTSFAVAGGAGPAAVAAVAPRNATKARVSETSGRGNMKGGGLEESAGVSLDGGAAQERRRQAECRRSRELLVRGKIAVQASIADHLAVHDDCRRFGRLADRNGSKRRNSGIGRRRI